MSALRTYIQNILDQMFIFSGKNPPKYKNLSEILSAQKSNQTNTVAALQELQNLGDASETFALKETTLTINGVTQDLSQDRTWTIAVSNNSNSYFPSGW